MKSELVGVGDLLHEKSHGAKTQVLDSCELQRESAGGGRKPLERISFRNFRKVHRRNHERGGGAGYVDPDFRNWFKDGHIIKKSRV